MESSPPSNYVGPSKLTVGSRTFSQLLVLIPPLLAEDACNDFRKHVKSDTFPFCVQHGDCFYSCRLPPKNANTCDGYAVYANHAKLGSANSRLVVSTDPDTGGPFARLINGGKGVGRCTRNASTGARAPHTHSSSRGRNSCRSAKKGDQVTFCYNHPEWTNGGFKSEGNKSVRRVCVAAVIKHRESPSRRSRKKGHAQHK